VKKIARFELRQSRNLDRCRQKFRRSRRLNIP